MRGGKNVLSFGIAKKNVPDKPGQSIEETVCRIQRGTLDLREHFILNFKPFIIKCVSKYTNHEAGIESSDEFSVALIAFNESISAFKMVKGMGFLAFSEIVIRNRLTDHLRKNSSQKNVIPFTSLETVNEEGKTEAYDVPCEDPGISRLDTLDEIQTFSLKLKEYGILFKDLVRCSPKHKDSRRRLISLARVIYSHPLLLSKMKKTKSLPINDLLEVTSVYRGTVEQNRKYIVALVLILDSRLDLLKSYIEGSSEGGGQNAD